MSFQGFITENLERRPGQKLSFTLAFFSLVLYIQIAYFTPRTSSAILIASFSVLFLFYLLLSKSIINFRILFVFGTIYRLIFVFSIPALSDDFYRFFWDGILIVNRINPFLYLPSEIVNNPAINIPELNTALYNLLNSPDYYTVYPPMSQFVFWISSWISDGNLASAVLVMKIMVFMAELGSIYLIWHVLKIYKLKKELTLLYILNPLVIIELTGNIHFEAFMIFFVLLTAFLIAKKKWLGGTVVFALAIISKLTPLLFLPFLLKRLKIKRGIVFYVITLICAGLAFLPFMGQELVHGLSSSIGLYFQKFEFNASVFYILREIGLWVVGYDIIQSASLWLGIITMVMILFIALYENTEKQNIPGIFLWPLFIYFTFASIVHPWYATPLVAFCLFSKYRFPIVWSFTIFLSYLGYTSNGFQEQTWVLWLEYGLVFGVMLYEFIKYKNVISIRNPWKEIIHTEP